MSIVCYLEREDSSGQNIFLISLCWASLNLAINAIAAENGPPTD